MTVIKLSKKERSARLDWAMNIVDQCCHWLLVPDAWRIQLMVNRKEKPNGINANVVTANEYLEASITLMPWVEPDKAGRETIIHEMLHICLADLRQCYIQLVQSTVPTDMQQLELMRYHDIEERTVTLMSRGLSNHIGVDDANNDAR